MKDVVEIDIDVAASTVGALFADPRNATRWMPNLEGYQPLSGEPGMPGSTYRLIPKAGNMVFVATVVSRNLPSDLRLELRTSNLEVAIHATVRALSPMSTRLISEEVFTFQGILSSIFGLFASRGIRAAHRQALESFKRFAEGVSASP